MRLRRITDCWMSARSRAVEGAWRRTAPKTQARPRATEAIRAAPPAPSAALQEGPADELFPQAEGEALDRHRHQRPDQQRPERGAERRVGRVRALGQQQRADPAAEEGAGAEAEQGQGADDQALSIAPQGQGQW